MITLTSSFLELSLDPQHACWGVQARQGRLALEGVRMRAVCRSEARRAALLKDWNAAEGGGVREAASPHGPLRSVRLALPPHAWGAQAQVEFALPEHLPALFWRVCLVNRGRRPLAVERLTLLEIDPLRRAAKGGPPPAVRGIRSNEARLFTNGWGSWNHSGAYGHIDRFRRTRLGLLAEPMRSSQGLAHPRLPGQFTSDMFGVLAGLSPEAGRETRRALLLGFLSQLEQFGSLDVGLHLPEPTVKLWANGDGARLDPGAWMETDWACLFLLDLQTAEPLQPYLEAVYRQSRPGGAGWGLDAAVRDGEPAGVATPAAPAEPGQAERAGQIDQADNWQTQPPSQAAAPSAGWSSWYFYHRRLSAEQVRRNLDFAAQRRRRLPLELIQIDDGFMTYAGDWYDFTAGFPDGLAPLAGEIRAAGFTPGLWLAPWIVDRRSRLAHTHPDWLVRSRWGGGRFNRPVNAGFLHNRLATALDLTHPAAQDFTRTLIETAVQRWGFPFLKLDFLYAAALPGLRFDPTRTRARAFRAGLELVRQAAGEATFLLGCGCPLGPAVGLLDGMRISADVDQTWFPTFTGRGFFFRPEPDMPSARNATHNSLARAALHRRWWINDPDCLLARANAGLSLAETRTLAGVIALSGGLWMISDDLPALEPERLRLAEALLPALEGPPKIIDWLDRATPARVRRDLSGPAGEWRLLALFNWEDEAVDGRLALVDYGLADGPGGEWIGREFWSGRVQRAAAGVLECPGIPAHGCVLFAVRRVAAGDAAYLGSDLHISQGLEVTGWEETPQRLALTLERPGPAQGVIDLALTRPPQRATLDGAPLAWSMPFEGVCRFAVRFERRAVILIE
ncbi:MAG: alpha-galactosidase, partial [Chloroflexota bacterium]